MRRNIIAHKVNIRRDVKVELCNAYGNPMGEKARRRYDWILIAKAAKQYGVFS